MQLELITVFEVLAFAFLALGLIPFGNKQGGGNLPLVNKLLFLFVATIMLFVMSFYTVSYDYTYCYSNETVQLGANFVSTATCDQYNIENLGLSYFNLAFGFVGILLIIIVMVMALSNRHDTSPDEQE